MNIPSYKRCGRCKETKSINLFGNSKSSKDGKRGTCKICRKEQYLEKRDEYLKKGRERYKRVKGTEDLKAYRREDYKKNRSAYLSRARKRYTKNKDQIAQYNRDYLEKNRDKINSYQLSVYKKKYKICPVFTARIANRNLMRRCIEKLKGNEPFLPFESYIGYSDEQLRLRISCQFKEGMSWENYGEWEIDHKIPVSRFISKGETRPHIINALSNLQPLWASENRRKGNRWVG